MLLLLISLPNLDLSIYFIVCVSTFAIILISFSRVTSSMIDALFIYCHTHTHYNYNSSGMIAQTRLIIKLVVGLIYSVQRFFFIIFFYEEKARRDVSSLRASSFLLI